MVGSPFAGNSLVAVESSMLVAVESSVLVASSVLVVLESSTAAPNSLDDCQSSEKGLVGDRGRCAGAGKGNCWRHNLFLWRLDWVGDAVSCNTPSFSLSDR